MTLIDVTPGFLAAVLFVPAVALGVGIVVICSAIAFRISDRSDREDEAARLDAYSRGKANNSPSTNPSARADLIGAPRPPT